jgi:hypothetical protein
MALGDFDSGDLLIWSEPPAEEVADCRVRIELSSFMELQAAASMAIPANDILVITGIE